MDSINNVRKIFRNSVSMELEEMDKMITSEF